MTLALRCRAWVRLLALVLAWAWAQGLALPALANAGTNSGAKPATLTLHYQDRPPYSSRAPDGQPQGLLVTPLALAFQRAGLNAHWELTPGQRQLVLIQSGSGMDCGVGWFRSAERETLGRFSHPIYQDQPFVALVRGDNPLRGAHTVASLLANPAQVLLVKKAYSYGPLIDPLLHQHSTALNTTTAENAQMARMVAAGRASWMIIAPEEAALLLHSTGDLAQPLRQLELTGVGPGPTRHLYCSEQVPEALLQRLNQALATR